MSTTPDLGIPLVSQQQQQPETTHNEAVIYMSAIFNGAIDAGRNTPPGSPTIGDCYIVGTAPTGAWAGRANRIAVYTTGGWRFLPDRDSAGSIIAIGARHKGMTIWVRDDGASPAGGSLFLWSGSAWVAVTGTRVED